MSTSSSNGSDIVSCGSAKCRKISETYSKANLPHGYLQIATIPSGALNISVRQLGHSGNRLVIKSVNDDHYIINGEGGISSSGTYEYDGVSFDYQWTNFTKSEKLKKESFESIFAAGPLLKPVDILILVKDENPGIIFEYLLQKQVEESKSELDYYEDYENQDWNEPNTPQDFVKSIKNNEVQEVNQAIPVPRKRRHKYMWKIISFSPCSKTCGGGIQAPIFRCIRGSPTRFYPARRCAHLEKPVFNENIYKCNMQPCPAYWYADHWQDCNCILAEGFQTRDIRCVQAMANGVVVEVTNSSCTDPKPDEVRKCECRIERRRVMTGRRHYASPRGKHITNPSYRKTPSNHSMGVWMTSNWYSNCTATCGAGFEYRSIFCDRTLLHSDRCNPTLIPDTVRPCVSKKGCEIGEWATTDWGVCSGECFNLQRRRQVFCVKNNAIVDSAECNSTTKPPASMGCTLDDVKYCRPRWYYSEWTTCSKTCGGGMQRRSVRCLEINRKDNILQESQKCLYVEREPIYSTCNTMKCPEMLMDSRIDLVENQVLECSDLFKNCGLINKAKFCKLSYYQRHCCLTCKGYL